MSIYKFFLPPTVTVSKSISSVDIDLYGHADTLYTALRNGDYIARLDQIPQLGPVFVPKDRRITRLQYMNIQLYLHQVARKQRHCQWEYSYGSNLFTTSQTYKGMSLASISIAEALQMLVILYNVGHFYNTFCASRAIILQANANTEFKEKLCSLFHETEFREIAKNMINQYQYEKWHLLNTYLLLQNITLSTEDENTCKYLLLLCLGSDTVTQTSKTKYLLRLFYEIRGLAYAACDLHNFKLALSIDIHNRKEIETLLKELLSKYNNPKSTRQMLVSIRKLLSDVSYNEPANVLCYYNVSQQLQRRISQCNILEYHTLWSDEMSPINQRCMIHHYDKQNVLKLTFQPKHFTVFQRIFEKIQHYEHIDYGYYTRPDGEYTLLVNLKPHLTTTQMYNTTHRITQLMMSYLKPHYDTNAKEFTILAKFFLGHIFNNNHVEIKSDIEQACVYCLRGYQQKQQKLKDICTRQTSPDMQHETLLMLQQLSEPINDTSLLIPASIQVFHYADGKREDIAEFDGVVIHPYRKQILFLEAKNRKRSAHAVQQLTGSLQKFNIHATAIPSGRDAYAIWQYL